ncbi:MAG: AtpZ/AtpI family protein [Chloroflexi bacterium]|nr:AtpZ/AtpI family protein [Chloroflexota bacterium]MCI0886571.1 AtpZ/AtpI family protein [Chloroflexota bacterium]
MGTVLQLVGIGWYVGICIAGGSFGGLWLDRKFDTGPLLTLLGLALGLVVALTGMFRMLMAVLSDDAGPDKSGGSPA